MAPLDVFLSDADALGPLLTRDDSHAREEVIANLIQLELLRGDGGRAFLGRRLGVGPARRHEALTVARGVEPFGNARIAIRDYPAECAVIVDHGLEAARAARVVGEVVRFAPQLREREADALRLLLGA